MANSETRVSVGDDALSEWNAVEERYDQKRGLNKGADWDVRQLSKGIVIDVPPASAQTGGPQSAAAPLNGPVTKLYFVEVEEPDMHKPTGDLERLAYALKDQWDIDNVTCDLA